MSDRNTLPDNVLPTQLDGGSKETPNSCIVKIHENKEEKPQSSSMVIIKSCYDHELLNYSFFSK